MTIMDIKYQLFPPSNYRLKNTEIVIQTVKSHFIAGLCSVYKYFCLQLWYRLLQQATTSLNLLRKSIIHPHISAYTDIFDEFNYNFTPLAPPGTRVVIHNRPKYRTSYASYEDTGL